MNLGPHRTVLKSLREKLSYSKARGTLTWLSNERLAGTVRKDGYVQTQLNGRLYLTHQLIWLLENGKWPEGYIHHKDGNRSNNRITNLEIK